MKRGLSWNVNRVSTLQPNTLWAIFAAVQIYVLIKIKYFVKRGEFNYSI